jgi:hypothetical protein
MPPPTCSQRWRSELVSGLAQVGMEVIDQTQSAGRHAQGGCRGMAPPDQTVGFGAESRPALFSVEFSALKSRGNLPERESAEDSAALRRQPSIHAGPKPFITLE